MVEGIPGKLDSLLRAIDPNLGFKQSAQAAETRISRGSGQGSSDIPSILARKATIASQDVQNAPLDPSKPVARVGSEAAANIVARHRMAHAVSGTGTSREAPTIFDVLHSAAHTGLN